MTWRFSKHAPSPSDTRTGGSWLYNDGTKQPGEAGNGRMVELWWAENSGSNGIHWLRVWNSLGGPGKDLWRCEIFWENRFRAMMFRNKVSTKGKQHQKSWEFWSSYFIPNMIYYDIQTGHVQNCPEFFHRLDCQSVEQIHAGQQWDEHGSERHRVQGGRWLPGGYELWNEKPNNWTIGFLYQMVLRFCIVK